MIHILKIKGTKTIPDFVQIREENFSLKAYFRADQIEKGLKKNNISDEYGRIAQKINSIPFGKMIKFEENE